MQNKQSKIAEKKFTDVLSYQLSDSERDNCAPYKEPLFWFISLCSTHGIITKAVLAQSLNMTPSALNKKLNPKSTQARPITTDELENICSTLGIPLSAVLYLYEKRDIIEKRASRESLSRMIRFFSGDLDYFFESDYSKDFSLADSFILKEQVQIEPPDNKLLKPLLGKWYCYFPSSESKIVEHRKKFIAKQKEKAPEDPFIKELYDLVSPDHIYGGIFIISQENQKYHATLTYMTDPSSLSVLRYEGILTYPSDRRAIFTTLVNKDLNDVIYVIIDTLSIEPEFNYTMANVLFLSSNKIYERRRPCSARMILSRIPLTYESPGYNAMLSNLMMNDRTIRLDEYGYNELIKLREYYASPALDIFLETYPSFKQFRNSNSQYIRFLYCAYIDEQFISLWKPEGVTDSDKLYLEALFRLHSISPWYIKTKASKASELLNTINNE